MEHQLTHGLPSALSAMSMDDRQLEDRHNDDVDDDDEDDDGDDHQHHQHLQHDEKESRWQHRQRRRQDTAFVPSPQSPAAAAAAAAGAGGHTNSNSNHTNYLDGGEDHRRHIRHENYYHHESSFHPNAQQQQLQQQHLEPQYQRQQILEQMPHVMKLPPEGNNQNYHHHPNLHHHHNHHRQQEPNANNQHLQHQNLPAVVPAELQMAFDQLDQEIREVFHRLNPEQQVQALEMLAAQQQQMQMEQMEQLQQQQQQQQQLLMEQQEAMMTMMPTEHFLTIALNGTILGATEMVTGFPPSNLLWTSVYDLVHDDDLLSLHAIKTHFWERDQPDVEVYLRRRTIEGEWIWLVANVVSYIDSPVPGIIVHETIVRNEALANVVNRITRIASLLLQAVESSMGGSGGVDGGGSSVGSHAMDLAESPETVTAGSKKRPTTTSLEDPMMTAAAAAVAAGAGRADIQAMLSEAAKSTGVEAADTAAAEGQSDKYSSHRNKNSKDHLHYLKTGASLDLSRIILSMGEIKLVMLVLTGRLQVKDLKPLICLTLNTPEMDLVAATDEYYHLSEQLRLSGGGGSHMPSFVLNPPPPIAMINFSYTEFGDYGMEILSELIYAGNASLKSLDLSFCNISSQGLLSLCHGLKTRSARGLPSLQALALTGNTIEFDVAKQLGGALSTELHYHAVAQKGSWDASNQSLNRSSSSMLLSHSSSDGLRLLHLGCTSISSRSLIEILTGLGPTCPLEELKINSNKLGSKGAATLVAFLNGKSPENGNQPVLPKLNRIDVSYNNLGDIGTTKLIRAISKRAKINVTEASLSGNEIGSSCIERIMNIFLLHKLITLNLDNNCIGDQGCQLVAASLPSIPSLTRLNLAFNDIGYRGMATLMRALIGCESLTSLALSGIAMRISGAIAMGFTLAQHPRLSTLELHNCCLSQVAQCHIVAGIISNRWVPMKVIHGFRVGPPMVAIGALEVAAQHLTNEECLILRRDIQMKTLLQWVESNRNSSTDNNDPNLLSNVSAPPQSMYLRMLDWLGRIPFDESELMDLQRYFYDTSYGEGDQRSRNNLKHRGDILAALASEVVEEILESEPVVYSYSDNSIGLDLSKLDEGSSSERDEAAGNRFGSMQPSTSSDYAPQASADIALMSGANNEVQISNRTPSFAASLSSTLPSSIPKDISAARSSMSTLSMGGMRKSDSRDSRSSNSMSSFNQLDNIQHKARITMFPHFAAKLDNLKAVAQEMMDNECDPEQQDIVAQQFAEASLTILRQLRYHCMESGLDGWRQGKLRRKILIVDDSVVTRKLVTRAFEKANFIVDTAEDGVMGVNKMKESIYDIAFMDIDMPVMNGFDATKAFRMWEDAVRPGARQPICALTAAHVADFDKCELMKFKDAGLDVMESKPCNISRLFKVVDDVAPMFSDLSINASQYDSSAVS